MNVGPLGLEDLELGVRRIANEYLLRPLPVVLSDIARTRTLAFSLLEGHQRHAQRSRLFVVAGQLSAMLAYCCFDLGYRDATATHAAAAWLCADEADDNSLRAYVRWAQSNVAYWYKHYSDAAELARDGQSYAGAGSTMLRLASQEARIESARGDAQRVAAALGRATTAMAATTDDDPGGVFRFPTGKAAYYASEARLAIGGASNIAHATTAAATALDLFAEAPPIDRPPEYIAAAQLDLISAHLAAGELDGADEMLQSVLAVPASSRTTPVLERIKSVPQRLPATVGYRGAELREQLMSYILSAKARDTAPPKELD